MIHRDTIIIHSNNYTKIDTGMSAVPGSSKVSSSKIPNSRCFFRQKNKSALLWLNWWLSEPVLTWQRPLLIEIKPAGSMCQVKEETSWEERRSNTGNRCFNQTNMRESKRIKTQAVSCWRKKTTVHLYTSVGSFNRPMWISAPKAHWEDSEPELNSRMRMIMHPAISAQTDSVSEGSIMIITKFTNKQMTDAVLHRIESPYKRLMVDGAPNITCTSWLRSFMTFPAKHFERVYRLNMIFRWT